MSIVPSKTESNTWLISFSIRVDGELRFVNEEFAGNIKDALSYERQLRGLAQAGEYVPSSDQIKNYASVTS
jgi:hypothetical protein